MCKAGTLRRGGGNRNEWRQSMSSTGPLPDTRWMQNLVHPASGLSKATWTEQDFDAMSWNHLCRIHALAVTGYEGPPDGLTPEEFLEQDDVDDTAPSDLALHVDLDYIARWVESPGPGPLHSVESWVAPATLVFRCVAGISGDLRCLGMPLEMENLHRSGPVVPHDETTWHLEGDHFDLRFRAWGFTLYIRRPPLHGRRVLRMAERGGISFEAQSFA
jgi:hypothetical protein